MSRKMALHVHLLVSWLVGRSVCHNFLKLSLVYTSPVTGLIQLCFKKVSDPLSKCCLQIYVNQLFAFFDVNEVLIHSF